MNVLNDTDGVERIEVETDGSIVKIGNDVEAGNCLTFNYENFRDFETEIRHHEGSTNEFKTEPDEYVSQKYCVWRPSMGEYRIFKDRECVLVMLDHEAGPLYTAQGMAYDIREDDFEYEDIAESWLEVNKPPMMDIEELSTNKRKDEVRVVLRQEDPANVRLGFYEELKEMDETSDANIVFDYGDLRYQFSLDIEEVDDETSS